MYIPNATLTFEVNNPSSTQDLEWNEITGNYEMPEASIKQIVVPAILRPTKPEQSPTATLTLGVDNTRKYYIGRVIGSINDIPPMAQAKASIDQLVGIFYLDPHIASPHGGDRWVGQRIGGWFEITGNNSGIIPA